MTLNNHYQEIFISDSTLNFNSLNNISFRLNVAANVMWTAENLHDDTTCTSSIYMLLCLHNNWTVFLAADGYSVRLPDDSHTRRLAKMTIRWQDVLPGLLIVRSIALMACIYSLQLVKICIILIHRRLKYPDKCKTRWILHINNRWQSIYGQMPEKVFKFVVGLSAAELSCRQELQTCPISAT